MIARLLQGYRLPPPLTTGALCFYPNIYGATLSLMRARVLAPFALLLLATPAARAEVIVRGGSARYTQDIVEALRKEAGARGASVDVVELAGVAATDQARIARFAAAHDALFAVGPQAVVAAGAAVEASRTAHVVALGVPNPDRVKVKATYVAFYPPLLPLFRWMAARFEARTFGFLYTPSQNAAVAAAFEEAAKAAGATLRTIPAASSGELVRGLKALREVDVLLCPVDPLLFDRESLRIVTDEARAAKKPLLGFLPDMPQLGFTAALVSAPEAVARAAWQASRGAAPAEAKIHEVDGLMLYITKDQTTSVDLAEKPGERRRR